MRGHGLPLGAPAYAGSAGAVSAPFFSMRDERRRFVPLCVLLCLLCILAPIRFHVPGHPHQTAVSGEQTLSLPSFRAETDRLFFFTSACCLPPDSPQPHARAADARRHPLSTGCRFWLLHFREGMRHILLM